MENVMRALLLLCLLIGPAFGQGAATRDPVATDDVSKGYQTGSIWQRTDNLSRFYAITSAARAAVWRRPNWYPADIGPVYPVLAYGTSKLKSNAVLMGCVWKLLPSPSQWCSGFLGDSMNAVGLDTFLGGQTGIVTTLWDQTGGGNNAAIGTSGAPAIRDLHIGGERSIVYEGGSQSGALHGIWIPSTIAPLNITPQGMTLVVQIQPSSALHRNQAAPLEPEKGVIVSLNLADGGVLNFFQDGGDGANPNRVGYGVGDGTFSWTNTMDVVETTPSVVAFVLTSTGVTIRQNDVTRSSSTHSTRTAAATVGMIGHSTASVAGKLNHALDAKVNGILVYNTALSAAQLDVVMQSLSERAKIAPQRKQNLVVGVGDSIYAGFSAFGRNGVEPRLQALLNEPARFANFAVPGQTASPNGSPYYGYLDGMFGPIVAPHIAGATKAAVVVSIGGNDFVIAPQPNPATVYSSITSLVNQIKTAGAIPIICTVLPRDATYQPQIEALNVMIRNGAGPYNYVLADIAADPVLSVPPAAPYPNARYVDQGHPAEATFQDWAEFMAPIVNSAMGW